MASRQETVSVEYNFHFSVQNAKWMGGRGGGGGGGRSLTFERTIVTTSWCCTGGVL